MTGPAQTEPPAPPSPWRIYVRIASSSSAAAERALARTSARGPSQARRSRSCSARLPAPRLAPRRGRRRAHRRAADADDGGGACRRRRRGRRGRPRPPRAAAQPARRRARRPRALASCYDSSHHCVGVLFFCGGYLCTSPPSRRAHALGRVTVFPRESDLRPRECGGFRAGLDACFCLVPLQMYTLRPRLSGPLSVAPAHAYDQQNGPSLRASPARARVPGACAAGSSRRHPLNTAARRLREARPRPRNRGSSTSASSPSHASAKHAPRRPRRRVADAIEQRCSSPAAPANPTRDGGRKQELRRACRRVVEHRPDCGRVLRRVSGAARRPIAAESRRTAVRIRIVRTRRARRRREGGSVDTKGDFAVSRFSQ